MKVYNRPSKFTPLPVGMGLLEEQYVSECLLT